MPYTQERVPRAGATVCLAKCCEFRRGLFTRNSVTGVSGKVSGPALHKEAEGYNMEMWRGCSLEPEEQITFGLDRLAEVVLLSVGSISGMESGISFTAESQSLVGPHCHCPSMLGEAFENC